MFANFLLSALIVLAAGPAWSKDGDCDVRCERAFKACSTSGKGTPRSCLAEREKCRKSCLKNTKTSLAK
jgi:hypothetical protein